MKYYIAIALLTAASAMNAQNIVKMSAVKANNYGVTYSLPNTSIVITADYTKTTRKAGQFYQYAQRYLNISNPIIEDDVIYEINNIEANTKGIEDKDKSYLVEFKPNCIAPFVSLTKNGLICAINSDYTSPKQETASNIPDQNTQTIDPSLYFSEEILRAGSSAKQAELIAKKIYQLRESRNSILNGEADNMPPDGDAYKLVMKQLEEQEKALTGMFTGTETVENLKYDFTIVPDEKNISDKVIFRFSTKMGVVDADNLGGTPVYLTLKNLQPKQDLLLTPKEQKDIEKKFSKGIIYNIPGKADLKIEYNNKIYVNTECMVVQYGTQDVLTPEMFDNKKQPIKVIFYPDQGSIKEIIQ